MCTVCGCGPGETRVESKDIHLGAGPPAPKWPA